MTSQPATTMRNNLNGGFRVAVDATTRVFDNLLNLRNPFDGTFDVALHVLSPYEATVVQKIFKQAFPEEGSKLFREAADLEAVYGKEGPLAVLGRKFNVLNTMSDNIWKKAVLAASLTRRISDKNIAVPDDVRLQLLKNKMSREMDRNTVEIAIRDAQADGELDTLFKGYKLDSSVKKKLHFHDLLELDRTADIDDSIIKASIEDAYDFVYQRSFEGKNFFGKIAKGTIKAHQDMPFVISSFMPFPRFVANQIRFLHEHAPLIGLLPLDKPVGDMPVSQYIKQKLPKQMTGAMMLMTAYNWRLKQGDTTNWYEFKDNNDNVVDGRPVYGPFISFILAADIMIRYQNGSLPATISPYVRDALQATLGSTFRAGMGLYTLDKAYTDLEDGRFGKSIAETIGNIFNTFTPSVIKGGLDKNNNKSTDVSVLGSIAAGTPIEAIQQEVDRVALPEDLQNNGEHYGLKVKGDSMIEAGIADGDTVIIKKVSNVDNGQIAVVVIDDQEATLKRVRKKGNTIALEAANRNYGTKIYAANRIKIQGKLVSLYRNFH